MGLYGWSFGFIAQVHSIIDQRKRPRQLISRERSGGSSSGSISALYPSINRANQQPSIIRAYNMSDYDYARSYCDAISWPDRMMWLSNKVNHLFYLSCCFARQYKIEAFQFLPLHRATRFKVLMLAKQEKVIIISHSGWSEFIIARLNRP